MQDRLLDYYERELTYIRKMGAEFAHKYPKIAGRLLLEEDKCEDPHTERLIEAFALISGRIHKKIDDEFSEITESLLCIIYPHYTNPVPSMSIVRFEPVGQNIPESGYVIDKGAALFSKPVRGTPCRFSTTLPVRLWPVLVVGASIGDPKTLVRGAVAAIEIVIQSFNRIPLHTIAWQHLRFFLNGPHQHVFHLYELLFNHVCRIECEVTRPDGTSRIIALAPEDIQSVGFADHHRMLPYAKRSFPGYLMLFEFFCFPEKFLFFDVAGIDGLGNQAAGDTMTLRIYLNRSAKADLVVNADTFCLNASPVVNLFPRIAEPIRVEHRKTEYPVIPDVRRQDAMEVYRVEQVMASVSGESGVRAEYKPFYSVRHHLGGGGDTAEQTFWHLHRRPSTQKDDNGTDVFLSFSDLSLRPTDPAEDILTVRTICTNRDLPARLPFGDPAGDFSLETAAPVSKIICMRKPTPTRRPSYGGQLQWRLISHFSLNYMSLVQGGEQALKEILRLYDFENSLSSQQMIDGIVSVDSRHITTRIKRAFCRGIRVTLTLDEDKYVGTGLFLFASVLERFLAQYVSVNSFSQLELRTLQREMPVKRWPPRSGNQVLL